MHSGLSIRLRRRCEQEREREKELELIKKQYLGTEKVKKKIRKPSEKFHLNFDWETADDTSKDLNPIYNQTHEAALLFGSGKRAGVDVQEQKKMAAEHQRQLLKKMRQAQVPTNLLLDLIFSCSLQDTVMQLSFEIGN